MLYNTYVCAVKALAKDCKLHYEEGQISMKCPICGQELRPGKKDPNYLLCYNCKKKFKVPQKQAAKKKETQQEEQKYSNIPPKHVRKKREDEMRKAYDEMLSVGEEKRKRKRVKEVEEYEDDFYDYEDDEKMSKAPVIILAIAILVVAGLIAFMLLR